MAKAKLIILVGMPGAGKSTCVNHLKEKGLPSVYLGGITMKEIQVRGLEVTESNEKIVREDLRKTEGNDVYARRSLKEIQELEKAGHGCIIIDGVYSWTEYKVFKSIYQDDALVIAITAPRALRHQRLAARSVRPLTKEQASSREYAEIENLEKGGPIANADYTLINATSQSILMNELDRVISEAGIDF